MIPALLLFAALAQTADGTDAPAVPPTPTAESPAAPAAPSPVADADMREFAAITGRKVVGRPAGGPYGTADKLLLLARDDKGYPVVGGSTGFPTRQSLPAPPPGTLAIIRLRQKAEMIVPGPSADDLAFVAAHRIPLFVIGEWARPAPMWEVAWVDEGVRYRSIGEVGEIGPWRD